MGKWAWPFLLVLLLVLPARAQSGANQAVLVVAYGDGRSETHCVTFAEEQISGYALLQRAGLDLAVDTSSAGTAVCGISGVGCPVNDCFCQCRGADCQYWSYWQWRAEEWQYATVGAHVLTVQDGAVQGWTWGQGSVTAASPPPVVAFSDVCAGQPGMPEETAVSHDTAPAWPAYGAFAFILLLLGGLLLRRRSA